MKKPSLIVITGPTASGKSALAVSLASRLETEIISADSRQIYRGIPVVTAVPDENEKGGIPHHLMEILPLEAYYSASKFEEDVKKILPEIFKKSDFAIVCGGSMLYIDSLTKGLDEIPTVPAELRASLMQEWKEKGDGWLLNELRDCDADYYQQIDHRNLKRVFHAVEVSKVAGQPYSSLLTGKVKNSDFSKDFDIYKFCLTGPREKLFSRINTRVEQMIEKGLEEEARKVYPSRHLNSLNTVGLKEMFAYFDGLLSYDEAIARIQKNTRVYAKKQLTWHKKDDSLSFLDFENPFEENVEKILEIVTH